MSIQWDKAYDITKDYRNQRLEVAPIYVKNPDGTYSLRTEITFDEDT
jgi:hypothetical protein